VRVIGLGQDPQGRARTLISIEQVREVQKQASLKPYEGAFRVFIIDGVDRLSEEAANSLLKTLEEPPDQVVLVLLASDSSAVLTTIRSRCRTLELRPVSVDTIEDHLVNALGVEPEAAQEVARLSGGKIGWAIQAAEEPALLERLADRLDGIERTVMAGLEPRFEYAAQLAGRFSQSRANALEELGLWLGWWRDVMIVCEGKPELVWHTSRRSTLEAVASGLDAAQSAVAVKAVERAVSLLERNVNPRLALEELMLAMPRAQSPEKVAQP
jgi:DNA polymerase-3 subunit delta'